MSHTNKLISFLEDNNLEMFKKTLFLCISEKIESKLLETKNIISQNIVCEQEDPQLQAQMDMEKRQTYSNPMFSKEFFLADYEHKGHTITLKSLGTGLGKPVLSYIDDEDFEVFPDRELAKKESMNAVDRMVKRGLDSIKDLRKTDNQLKKEAEIEKQQQQMQQQQMQQQQMQQQQK